MRKYKATPIDAAIGALVRRLRKAHKLTQTEFCKLIGVEQSAVSRIEKGLQTLTAPQWVRTCQALDLRGDQIVTVCDGL